MVGLAAINPSALGGIGSARPATWGRAAWDGLELVLVSPKKYGARWGSARLVVDIPFEDAAAGCELIYGAVLFDHPPLPPAMARSTLRETRLSRALIRFRYDLKSRKCESKDLSLDIFDLPERIRVQLVRVVVTPEAIEEVADQRVYAIELADARFPPPVTFSTVDIVPGPPWLSSRRTRRVPFSSALPPAAVEVLMPPYDDLERRIVREIDAHVADCRRGGSCADIVGSVAIARTPSIQAALLSAEAAGVGVEIIVAPQPRLYYGDFGHRELPRVGDWQWLRGDGDVRRRGKLEMHTKFIVIGDDVVISSNANHDFADWPRSRSVAAVYTSSTVADIFRQVQALVRTAALVPVNIDLDEDFTVLFNASRPRAYNVLAHKPYVAHVMPSGERAGAYGVLFALIDETPGVLKLDMSPISNSCAARGRRRCLYEVLARKAQSAELDLRFNAYFWVPRQSAGAVPRARSADEVEWKRSFTKLLGALGDSAARPRVMTEATNGWSSHHGRWALLGSELTLLGSANYATPQTVNTIEILRDAEVRARLAEEWESMTEPYYVHDRVLGGVWTSGRCEVSIERDLYAHPQRRPVVLDESQLRAEALRRYGAPLDGPLDLLEVPAGATGLEQARWREVAPRTESATTYVCVRERTSGRTFVLRGAPMGPR